MHMAFSSMRLSTPILVAVDLRMRAWTSKEPVSYIQFLFLLSPVILRLIEFGFELIKGVCSSKCKHFSLNTYFFPLTINQVHIKSLRYASVLVLHRQPDPQRLKITRQNIWSRDAGPPATPVRLIAECKTFTFRPTSSPIKRYTKSVQSALLKQRIYKSEVLSARRLFKN